MLLGDGMASQRLLCANWSVGSDSGSGRVRGHFKSSALQPPFSVPQVLTLLQSAVPSCTDGRHQDAVRVLNCSLNSMDLDD